ncbi:MAG: phosphate signaling complex protein PhoU [Syntrophorhabdaceae bacterium]|nr:phosphate signaling complex protein PhoU [Syntrophorhabdaceae bacterium]
MLQEKLEVLRTEMVKYGLLVEEMIKKSIRGLLEREISLLNEVIEKDEPEVNKKEISVDYLCITAIAQFQPVAGDLRRILMAYRMNADFERIADHAVNISRNAIYLIDKPPIKPLIDIPRMAQAASWMLKGSIDAYIKEDVELAGKVCERDDEVDALMLQILRELITYMSSDPKTIERAIRLLTIARNLERVADLTTNLSEDVIFMVEGRVVKHRKDLGM